MPQPVAIASDSSVDLSLDEATRRGITVAPIQVALSRDYFQDTALPRAEFYRRLPHEPRLPTIVAPLSGDFVVAYREAAKYGDQVLCLINPFESCSTYSAAYGGSLTVKKENNLTVEVVNTGRGLTGLGATCLAAAALAARGAGMAEVISAIEAAIAQTDTFYAPATSEYLRRDGRISLYEMQVGSLEEMLPLIRVWGRVAVIDKRATQAENTARMLDLAADKLNGREAVVVVTHADNRAGAEGLAQQVRQRLRCAELLITELGPSAGAYCGAGTVGLGFCPRLVH
jgi:DegV family protein with EDD domain